MSSAAPCHASGCASWETFKRVNGWDVSGRRIGSDAAFLAGPTTVVRDRRDVLDQLHVQTSRLQRRDRALAARTRTLDADLDVPHAELARLLRRLLGGALAGKRG